MPKECIVFKWLIIIITIKKNNSAVKSKVMAK